MARVNVPVSAGMQGYPALPIAANSADLAFTAADLVDKNRIDFAGASMLIVIVHNTDAGAVTIDINSAPDGLNRTGDIDNYAMAAGEIAAFVLQRNGWRQSDGYLYCEASDAQVLFAAIRIGG